MKQFLNILFWIAVIVYYFVAMGFVSERRGEQICTAVRINVVDSVRSRFVTANDIALMVDDRAHKLTGVRFDSINVPQLEQRLTAYPPIRRAVIYKTINGTVHIDVTQRTPVVRVINRYGESFYLDERGEMLQHSNRYAAHVLVAGGYINLRPQQQKPYNVLTAEIASERRNIMRELFDLAAYINGNRFWKAQIQQIYVNEDGEFELIPLVGAHVIVFGTFDKHDAKFAKLMSFYRNGLNVNGWNTYNVINLKYEGQIVATKR
jgi:cell division protein FtsQ